MSPMTFPQQAAVIALCVLATTATRFLPFLIFSGKRETPAFVRYLGRALPGAIFALLVVYCLRSISFAELSGYAPALIAGAVVVCLHIWRRNTLLSIIAGTLCYMILVQTVF